MHIYSLPYLIIYYASEMYVSSCSCSHVIHTLATFYTDTLHCPCSITWAHPDSELSKGEQHEMVWLLFRKIDLLGLPGLPQINQARKVMSYPKRMTDTFWPRKLNFLSFSALKAPKVPHPNMLQPLNRSSLKILC